MRLLLFSLFLVSVSVRSAPLDEAKLNVTGVVEGRDDDDDDVPDDCCQPRETPCRPFWSVKCYPGEWVYYGDDDGCFPLLYESYECCGRCACKGDHYEDLCTERNRKRTEDDQFRYNDPGFD